jgi:hypothetical protein
VFNLGYLDVVSCGQSAIGEPSPDGPAIDDDRIAAAGAGFEAESSGEGSNLDAHSIDDLAWMAGYWVGEMGGARIEECWLEPCGDMLLGIHRKVQGSGPAFFEYLRIERTPQGIVYFAGPSGREPTGFALAESSGRRVVFENPAHDFPRRIIYWLDDSAALHARIEGTRNGKPASSEWMWQRRVLE